jgi:hypothetical protein
MPYIRNARRRALRPMRREAAGTVAVVPDRRALRTLRAHAPFPFDDHTVYLRRVESLLRSLEKQGLHVRVALFDPEAYTHYCAASRLDPGAAASRARWTAEVAASGVTLPVQGRPLAELLPLLRDHHARRAVRDRALDVVGRAAADGRGTGHHDRAADALAQLLAAVGTGRHHMVCTVMVPGGPPLVAALTAERTRDGGLRLAEPDGLLLCAVLAAGLASGAPGGLVVRSRHPGEATTARAPREVVRGWSLHGDWLRPLTEAEVFAAYCTDPATGEPVPPEHGVLHRAGLPLPRRPDGPGR